MNRLGQKTGAGFYRYESGDRKALPDPAVTELIEQLAARRGIARRNIDAKEIAERCMLQLINVGAQVLESGIAVRAADIDVVWVHGYGFPRHLGGPMFYADRLGSKRVLERIEHYRARIKSEYWRPAALIEQLARHDKSFAQWDSEHVGS
jgi:3-hydroxyacyl-CoA dehydrogenase